MVAKNFLRHFQKFLWMKFVRLFCCENVQAFQIEPKIFLIYRIPYNINPCTRTDVLCFVHGIDFWCTMFCTYAGRSRGRGWKYRNPGGLYYKEYDNFCISEISIFRTNTCHPRRQWLYRLISRKPLLSVRETFCPKLYAITINHFKLFTKIVCSKYRQ